MEFRGRIFKVFDVQTGTSKTGNEWKKQDFIFEYFENDTDRWSDKVVLSVMNDRIAEVDLHEGDEVKIGFGHNVREFNGKYYNECRMYKLEKDKREQPATPSAQTMPTAPEQQPTTNEEKEDDLPF